MTVAANFCRKTRKFIYKYQLSAHHQKEKESNAFTCLLYERLVHRIFIKQQQKQQQQRTKTATMNKKNDSDAFLRPWLAIKCRV